VLYVFYKTPRLRTVTSYYLITLAISDIAMAVLVMPGITAISACGYDVLGSLVGTIIMYIFTELVLGSLQTTMLIAVNRYFCVVKHSAYRKYFSSKSVIVMIVSFWIFNLAPTIALHGIGISTADFSPTYYMRFANFHDLYTERIINAIYQVFFTILPATLIVLCYWKIHKEIKNHKASLASNPKKNELLLLSGPSNHETPSRVEPNQLPSPSAMPSQASPSFVKQNRPPSVVSNRTSSPPVADVLSPSLSNLSSSSAPNRTTVASNRATAPSNRTTVASNQTLSISSKEIKLTKSLFVIVIGFCICWFPQGTLINISGYVQLPRLVGAVVTYCAFISSAINPILYNIYNRPFRRRACQLLISGV